MQLIFVIIITLFTFVFGRNATIVKVYGISADITTVTSRSQTVGHIIALNEINNNSSILPDYSFQLEYLESNGKDTLALIHSVEITESYRRCEYNISPIVLGCPWSSSSILTARIFDYHNLIQISSSSTSIDLSTHEYKAFFRTIPNDELQGQAIIKLCNYYNWTKIGVVYQSENYGENLNKVIRKYGTDKSINVISKSITIGDHSAIQDAAQFVVDNELYITVLIMFSENLDDLFIELQKIKAISYPFFYIGVDSWFNEIDVHNGEFKHFVEGFIGTVPATPNQLTLEQYTNFTGHHPDIYNIAKKKREIIANGSRQLNFTDADSYDNFAGFSYDSVYAMAYTLDKIDKRYSLSSIINDCNLNSINLRQILIDLETFNGATGPVTFDENGNRINGFFAFGNMVNGKINFFGASSNDNFFIDPAYKIVFPSSFKHLPYSEVKTETKRIGIDKSTVLIIGIINSVILFLAMFLLMWKHGFFNQCPPEHLCMLVKTLLKEELVNIEMTIGVLLCGIAMLSAGLNSEQNNITNDYDDNKNKYDFGCVISLWLSCIIFTLIYIPLFEWSYKLKQIVLRISDEHANDNQLGRKIIYSLIVDIILLLIITVINTQKQLISYIFVSVNTVTDDNDVLIMYDCQYPICLSSHYMTPYLIILSWKCIQIGYVLRIVPHSGILSLVIIGVIALIWMILNDKLQDNSITKQSQYIILSTIVISVNILWIIGTSGLLGYCKEKYIHFMTRNDESTGNHHDIIPPNTARADVLNPTYDTSTEAHAFPQIDSREQFRLLQQSQEVEFS
eukprot:404258_1